MDFFSELRNNIGGMLSDEQKEDLQEAGRQFYNSIDMEKFKPIPAEEAKELPEIDEEHVDRIRYAQLKKALDSGLLEEDLDEEERKLVALFKNA